MVKERLKDAGGEREGEGREGGGRKREGEGSEKTGREWKGGTERQRGWAGREREEERETEREDLRGNKAWQEQILRPEEERPPPEDGMTKNRLFVGTQHLIIRIQPGTSGKARCLKIGRSVFVFLLDFRTS